MKSFRFISYLFIKQNKQPFYHAKTKENIRIKLYSEIGYPNIHALLHSNEVAAIQQKTRHDLYTHNKRNLFFDI